MKKIQRALISISDKKNLRPLLKCLKKFKDLSNEVIIGIDHDLYAHTSKLTEANREALSLDFN